MPRKKRLLRGCLVTLLVLTICVVAAIVALMPGKGPPMLACLAPDADVILLARDAEGLWARLEASERFGPFRDGPAWRALVDSPPGRDVAKALEKSRESGFEVTRSRAAHLVGRETGAAVWFAPDGRRVRSWVAAFRIDTTARVLELVGRLALGSRVTSSDSGGERLHALAVGGGGTVNWCRMGDLLVASSDGDALRRAVGNCVLTVDPSRAGGGAAEAWASAPKRRFEVDPPADPPGFWLAARARAAPLMKAFPPAAKALEIGLRSTGVAPPVEEATLSLRLEGDTLLEEGFLRATPRPGLVGEGEAMSSSPARARPAGTYLFCSLRPDRDEAADRLRRALVDVLPLRASLPPEAETEMEIFVNLLLPRAWGEVVIAAAEQDLDVENGGFPAEFSFFRVTGAGALLPALQRALGARSLGVFGPRDPLPTAFPYLVERRSGETSIYEITILYTRRHEGYRPAVAVRGDEIIFCTSLDALERFLDEGGEAPPPTGGRLSQAGAEILRLDWRTPADLRPLKNSYDYMIELQRYRSRSASRLLSDTTDYAGLWRAIEGVLRELRAHERAAVAEEGGVRMRARWDFAR